VVGLLFYSLLPAENHLPTVTVAFFRCNRFLLVTVFSHSAYVAYHRRWLPGVPEDEGNGEAGAIAMVSGE
jgi:hypothetical protein